MSVTTVTAIRIRTLCALFAVVYYRTTVDAAIASVYACKRTRTKERRREREGGVIGRSIEIKKQKR
jgi:hypothetical protein